MSRDRVNAIVADKQAAPMWLDIDAARRHCTSGIGMFEWASSDGGGEDARAQILDETEGFVKLVFEGRSGRIVGAQVLGVDAAQLIAPLALAVHAGLGAAALAEVAFPHPMISEGINKAARAEHA